MENRKRIVRAASKYFARMTPGTASADADRVQVIREMAGHPDAMALIDGGAILNLYCPECGKYELGGDTHRCVATRKGWCSACVAEARKAEVAKKEALGLTTKKDEDLLGLEELFNLDD